MAENNIVVSIIVPIYGTEEYLPACIESLCKQTHPHVQIILVDDESPDKCPAICDAYAQKDNRITVIHQENKGVSGARNVGMRYAVGEYVMFVDSDDELYPNAVEIMLKDAEYYKADIVSATKRVVDKNGLTIRSCEDCKISVFREEEPLLLSLNGEQNTNSACAKLFRKIFINELCFEEGKNINEDGFFIFQCYLKKPILVQHNIAVYQYNVRTGSSSRACFSDKYLSMLYFCTCKKELVAMKFPQYIVQSYNMEVRTNLQFLQILCRTNDSKYKAVQNDCIKTVRKGHKHYSTTDKKQKRFARIVVCGLYPVYKKIIQLKYCLDN